MRLKRPFWAIVLWACSAACSTSADVPRSEPAATAHTVVVTSNGWHTSLIIAKRAVEKDRLPEASDLPDARYLEFGWGDRAYYTSERPTLGAGFMALFVPTSAVVHVAGLDAPPSESNSKHDVLTVPITAVGHDRLVDFIAATFDRSGQERATAVARGLYADSYFYPAHGEFHLFNTCNTWTARALAVAGVPIATDIVRADDLMRRVNAIVSRMEGVGAVSP